jgi:hypothetical protein
VAYSYVRYTGNGTTTNYTFPFNYLSTDHIKVRVNDVLVPGYTFLNSSTVKFDVAPIIGAVIEIRRETPKDVPIVNFTDGSVLLERDLDLLATFDLYLAQESADGVDETISVDSTGRWDGQGKRLGNLAPAINPDEVVIKETLDYEYPAVAVVASARADIAIVGSDLGAPTGQTTDLGSITDPVITEPGAGTSKIITVADNIADVQALADNLTAIQNASSNAAAAASSASSASTSATNAASSATSAASSAAAADSSKTAAAASATSAASSATSASGSASTATTQASNASNSASTASTAASNAATAATQAAASASSASTSATTATSAASSASSSASSASTSASAAAGSASTANTQASNAASSASSASGSATAAATSATNAANSATSAGTSATNASSSATAAASSASSASTSATNASSSATAAASSATAAASSAASAAALLDNFDDRYLGPKSAAPTVDNDGDPLLQGALYFDTTSGKMRVYTASGWVDASAASQAALTIYRYTATSGQTTFSGTSLNGTVLTYLAGGLVVSLNGIVLVGGGDDYTATNGTTIVLTSGATAGDTLEVYAFSSFSIASLNGSALVDATVTTAKLVDSSVTTAKLADNSVTSSKIVDGAVNTAELADNAVTNAKLADIDLGVLP